MNKLRDGLARLRRDLAPMTFSEKIDHIARYYWPYALAVLLAAALLAGAVTGAVNASREVLISGVVTNVAVRAEGFSYLSDGYFEHLNGKPGRQKVDVAYISFDALAQTQDVEANYSKALSVLAMISGGTLDYLILDRSALGFYITQDAFLDLRDFLTPDELETYADALVWAQPEGEQAYPAAVDISELPFVRENIDAADGVFFALSGRTARLETCRDFWRYLADWDSAIK